MAISATSLFASFDVTAGTQKPDVSPLLLKSLINSLSTLSEVPVGEAAQDDRIQWTEEDLNAHQFTSDSATYSSTATTINTAAGQGVRLSVGSLIRERADAETEVSQVTAISTDALTVTRGYGGTTGTTVAASATFDIISTPQQEGSDIGTDASRVQTLVDNYTQIYERSIKVTGSQQARAMYSIADTAAHSLDQRTLEVKRDLNKSVVLGVRNSSAAGGSDSQTRTMDGLRAFLTQSGANNTTTGEGLTLAAFNTLFSTIDSDGAESGDWVCFAPQKQYKLIAAFDASNRRLAESDTVAGYTVQTVLTDLGVEIPVVKDNYWPSDTIAFVDRSRVSLRPLVDRAWFILDAETLVDGKQARVVGEWTLECRDAKYAHAIHSGLT